VSRKLKLVQNQFKSWFLQINQSWRPQILVQKFSELPEANKNFLSP